MKVKNQQCLSCVPAYQKQSGGRVDIWQLQHCDPELQISGNSWQSDVTSKVPFIIENQWDFSPSMVVWLLFVINRKCYHQNRNQRGELKTEECVFYYEDFYAKQISIFSDLKVDFQILGICVDAKQLQCRAGKHLAKWHSKRVHAASGKMALWQSKREHDAAAGESQLFIKGVVQQVPSRQYGAGASNIISFKTCDHTQMILYEWQTES